MRGIFLEKFLPENAFISSSSRSLLVGFIALVRVNRQHRDERGYTDGVVEWTSGYMWKVTRDTYYAAGAVAQRLYVVPDDRLMIVHLAHRRGEEKVDNDHVETVYELILAAYRD